MSKLHISDDLHLPIEFVTQTQAILAKRGVGKTYTASVEAEEMLAAGQQIIVLDPTGAWFGLRSSADGKSEGYRIVVIGGEHADVPLEESSGEVIARSIVEHRFSAIIDLSLFRKGQVRRFVTPFLETLYRLNREAVHLFVDEADDLCPQRPFGDEAQMVGAMEDVVKRGRKRGIGCTLITQRPSDLAKQVLTQCEVLAAMRLTHPLDIKAVMEWINVHADPDKAETMIQSLPSLPIGTAWFWSPGWMGFFKQVKIRQRRTFDSSATPKVGQVAREPKKRAEIDVKALGEQIAATVEKAKADDPRELRKKIAGLERRLRDRPAETKTIEREKIVEVPVLKNGQLEKADALVARLMTAYGKVEDLHVRTKAIVDGLVGAISRATKTPAKATAPAIATPPRVHSPAPAPVRQIARAAATTTNGDARPAKAERAILTALAQLGPSLKRRIAVAAGYAVNGGGFGNAIGRCRSMGWAVDLSDGTIQITEDGLTVLGDFQPLPSGADLVAHWMGQLPKAEREILRVLVEAGGNMMTKDEIAAATRSSSGDPYDADGGGFGNAMGRLRTLELIEGRKDIRVCDELAGEG